MSHNGKILAMASRRFAGGPVAVVGHVTPAPGVPAPGSITAALERAAVALHAGGIERIADQLAELRADYAAERLTAIQVVERLAAIEAFLRAEVA
jgi:hypothetical protein